MLDKWTYNDNVWEDTYYSKTVKGWLIHINSITSSRKGCLLPLENGMTYYDNGVIELTPLYHEHFV